MGFYPVFLEVKGKACLVVGGGRVALQKARALRAAGARLTVVAPRFRPGFGRLAGLALVRRGFRASDLGRPGKGPWIVVAATDDEVLHRRIADLCRARRIWANVVDRPPLCDFIVPSVVRRGPLRLAVSTGGRSPALAKFIGDRLRRLLGPEYGRLGTVLARLRPQLKRLSMDDRRAFLKEFISDRVLDRLRAGDAAADRLKKDILAALRGKESHDPRHTA